MRGDGGGCALRPGLDGLGRGWWGRDAGTKGRRGDVMFASDRDLLAMEPNLFRDVGWVGQRLVSGTGGVAGTTLTLTAQDVDFEDGGVGAGCVVLVDGAPYEVLAR